MPAVGLVSSSDTAQRGLTRLALDLHDGPLQDMAAAGFGLNLLEQMLTELPSDTSEATAQLSEIRRELGAVEATLRELAARPGSGETQESVVEMLDREIPSFRSMCTATVELDLVG
ncbi:MAG: hypothetical protein H0X39_00545 [Actinobacteria bacterium]|nr:hypothetical protein [Actinomycetota bacterium]